MNALLIGLSLTLVAGIMSGNCMLPMKFVRRWRWEHVWLVFSLTSLLLLPWILGFSMTRHLLQSYRQVPNFAFLAPLAFGFGWGIAQILFGITIRRLGLGLGYAIVVGLGAVLGTVVPLLAGQRQLVSKPAFIEIGLGVLVMAIGIALSAWAGKLREHDGSESAVSAKPESGYATAVLLAVLCGLMAPMLNYAFAFGQALAQSAIDQGNAPLMAAYAVWPVALFGGLIPNLGYSFFLLARHKSWRDFSTERKDVLFPLAMAVLWMGAFSLYGMGAVYLGKLGTSVGWGLMQIFMIMTAAGSGLLSGEWKRAPRNAGGFLAAGMALLVAATVLLAFGSQS